MKKVDVRNQNGLSKEDYEAVESMCRQLTYLCKKTRTVVFCNADSEISSRAIPLFFADAMGKNGKKSLIINGDLSCANEALDGTQKGQGLVHYLAGQCGVESIIHQAAAANTDVVPAGETVSTPQLLFDKEKMGELLDFATQRYDWVFINASRLQPSDVTAAMLAQLSDGAVLVARDRVTRGTWLQEAKMTLEAAACNILGCIVLDVKNPKNYGGK